MQSVEPFVVQVSRSGIKILEFKTNCTAIVGKNNGATLCTSEDVELRVALASRVQMYLDSLIDTVIKDTAGQLRKSDIEDMIKRLNAMTETESYRKDPSTAQEILDRLKGGGNG